MAQPPAQRSLADFARLDGIGCYGNYRAAWMRCRDWVAPRSVANHVIVKKPGSGLSAVGNQKIIA